MIQLEKVKPVFFCKSEKEEKDQEEKEKRNDAIWSALYADCLTGNIDAFSWVSGSVLKIMSRSTETNGLRCSTFILLNNEWVASSHFNFKNVEQFLHGYYREAVDGVEIETEVLS